MDNHADDPTEPGANGIQPEQTSSTPVSQETAHEVPAEVISFYRRYEKAMIAWQKTHGKKPFPIGEVPDGKGGVKLKWFNREDRKRARLLAKKKKV